MNDKDDLKQELELFGTGMYTEEQLEAFHEACRELSDTICRFVTKIADVILDVFKRISGFLANTWDDILLASSTPKERHLMRYAKKRRTRKKYRNRIARRVLGIAKKGGEWREE